MSQWGSEWLVRMLLIDSFLAIRRCKSSQCSTLRAHYRRLKMPAISLRNRSPWVILAGAEPFILHSVYRLADVVMTVDVWEKHHVVGSVELRAIVIHGSEARQRQKGGLGSS